MNLEYENIIVAVDGSEASEKAFKKSVEIAKRNNAKLILTHVIDSRTFATAEAYDRTLAFRADVYATELLDLYMDKARTAGVKDFEKCFWYGFPKVVIAKESVENNGEILIILGVTGIIEID